MVLVDTHTHIFSDDFNYDRHQAIERAKSIGVKHMVLPNIDSTSVEALINVSQQYENFCHPCMGLHPTSVKENFQDELMIVEEWLQRSNFVAVGEIGIDFYWDKTFINQQKEAFTYQLRLAKKHKLPVIIHSRNSFDEILEIVDQENDGNLRGIFHSFSGNLDHYNRIVGYGGFFIGIGGVVTYKHGGVDKVLKGMDLNHIVLETDSPYLSPAPHRGKRNESANLVHILNKVAEVFEVTPNEVASITTQNAYNIFSLA
jgi:TatD DNase family protein